MGACREMRLPRSESESQSMSPSAALDSLAAATAPAPWLILALAAALHAVASGRRVSCLFDTLLPRVAPRKPLTVSWTSVCNFCLGFPSVLQGARTLLESTAKNVP